MQKHLGTMMLWLSCSAAQNSVGPATLQNVTTARNGADLRIEITLSAPVKPSIQTVGNPARLVLDFPDTAFSDRSGNASVHVSVHANRFASCTGDNGPSPTSDLHDLIVIGAGPAGISASLRAIENKLKYLTIERDEVGGTVAKYPRQKLVMTSPVEFPMYGKFKKMQLSKENLLAFWDMILNRSDFNVSTGERVEDVKKEQDGIFTVLTATNQYRARAVILALGKSGEPRKLGVPGEDLPKVMYRLIETDHYIHKKILVVGGGDSAVEAAMGLANQAGNQVTLSYRSERFSRIKERNTKRIEDCMRSGKVKVLFNSIPVEFKPESVVLDVSGKNREIPNDFVWIFAGGNPPNAFLKKIGVGFGEQDVTLGASKAARAAVAEWKEVAQSLAGESR